MEGRKKRDKKENRAGQGRAWKGRVSIAQPGPALPRFNMLTLRGKEGKRGKKRKREREREEEAGEGVEKKEKYASNGVAGRATEEPLPPSRRAGSSSGGRVDGHLNCLCVGGPPYWPSADDATPPLVGGCKGWPPPPTVFLPHAAASGVPPCPGLPPYLRGKRLYTRLSVPAIWTSNLDSPPPALLNHPPRRPPRRQLPGMTLFAHPPGVSPYLTPCPFRGRLESQRLGKMQARLLFIARAIAFSTGMGYGSKCFTR
ncbi:hypothetical protein KM043_008119 [Ampulex compressa]|nr:hypothetical protein KM043_008119 [Ampulex compressa]